jgi:protein involved in polysaccharide export with SLBB domain
MVHGEVLFPNAVVYRDNANLTDYIEQAGGYTQSANTSLVVILHPDGSFERAETKGWKKIITARISQGDEVLVLPRVDFKRLQITKDISQVIYQIALSAAVVLAL